MTRLPARAVWRSLALGLLLTLIQVFLACATVDLRNPVRSYRKLKQWDANWYGEIVTVGYRSTIPPDLTGDERSNVAFFPGFPLLAAAIRWLFNVDVVLAVLLASQLACWGFWTYVLLFLERWQVPRMFAVPAILLLLSQPAAFFLVTGYSESLFLAALLGYLYWSGQPGRRAWIIAAGHGIVLTGTKLMGVPCVVSPVASALLARAVEPARRRRQLLAGTLLAGTACLGAIAFFGYCQLRWGQWDLYMETQDRGWGFRPDYLALLRLDTYRLIIPTYDGKNFPSDHLSRLTVPLTAMVGMLLIGLDIRLSRERPETEASQRVGFYLSAAAIFYVSVAAKAGINMESMLRHNLPVHVLLILAAVHLAVHCPVRSRAVRVGTVLAVVIVAVLSLLLELFLTERFTRGLWIA